MAVLRAAGSADATFEARDAAGAALPLAFFMNFCHITRIVTPKLPHKLKTH